MSISLEVKSQIFLRVMMTEQPNYVLQSKMISTYSMKEKCSERGHRFRYSDLYGSHVQSGGSRHICIGPFARSTAESSWFLDLQPPPTHRDRFYETENSNNKLKQEKAKIQQMATLSWSITTTITVKLAKLVPFMSRWGAPKKISSSNKD